MAVCSLWICIAAAPGLPLWWEYGHVRTSSMQLVALQGQEWPLTLHCLRGRQAGRHLMELSDLTLHFCHDTKKIYCEREELVQFSTS